MRIKSQTINEFALYFDKELQAKLPITILPNGALGYKDCLVRQLSAGTWGLYNTRNLDLVGEYYLKSCALMAAKFFSHKQVEKRYEIKELDTNYWLHYTDSLIFKNNIDTVSDDRYSILLTRLEESNFQTLRYKTKISMLFKCAFI